MNRDAPSKVIYHGDIWSGPAVHPDLWAFLNQKNTLIEVTGGQPPYQVILGVPHHAALGMPRIADAWTNPKTGKKGRPADEAAGLTGLAVFHALREQGMNCKLVIAAHPLDHDPNKAKDSPYWHSVFASPLPDLLFELHGAGNHRRHSLELSAGRNLQTDPLAFGRILVRYLNPECDLAVQVHPGIGEGRLYHARQHSDTRLQNPALGTDSLSYAGSVGIRALHLEIKPRFRQPDPAYPDSPRPAPKAWQLARALALAVRAMHYPGGVFIPGSDLGLDTTAYLTSPSARWEASYLTATQEADQRHPAALEDIAIQSHAEFTGFVQPWEQVREDALKPLDGQNPPLTEEILWLIDQGEFVGRAFIFHWLDAYRREMDGQVDYWIRPSRRRQGYGTLILRLLLERFRQIGNHSILVTCESTNTASRKIIEANGGMFESEIPDALSESGRRRRYWITLA